MTMVYTPKHLTYDYEIRLSIDIPSLYLDRNPNLYFMVDEGTYEGTSHEILLKF
jgi:hypothetical protein